MSERHIGDELPLLLTGEASRDVVMTAAVHLRVCPDCQQELVSAVVAHASLASAHRYAPEVMSADDVDKAEDAYNDVADQAPPLPDLTTVFARAREDAEQRAQAPVRHRRRLIAVAAAAAVVVGGGATVAAVELSSSDTSGRTVQLQAFDRGVTYQTKPGAKVTIDGSKLRVDASKLPGLDNGHVYELWVTDGARKNMQPVGTFTNAKSVELSVASKVLARYSDFEVSVQRSADTGKYSGVSMVRGDYAD